MKKLILFLFLAIGFVVNAQTVFQPMSANSTAQFISTQYTLTNTTALNFVYTAPQQKPCTQDFIVKLDSISGDHTSIAITLFGAKVVGGLQGGWVQIATANVATTTSEHTITSILSNATANRYSKYLFQVVGTGTGTTRVTSQGLKLYLE